MTDDEGVVINFEIYFRWSCFVQMMYGSDHMRVCRYHLSLSLFKKEKKKAEISFLINL